MIIFNNFLFALCVFSQIPALYLFIYFFTDLFRKKKSHLYIFAVCVCQAGVQGAAGAAGGAAEPAAPQPEALPGEGAAALQTAALHSQHAPGRHAAWAGAQVSWVTCLARLDHALDRAQLD